MEWPTPQVAETFFDFSSYTNGDGIINSSASANTKGSYELMVTSLARDLHVLEVVLSSNTFAVRDTLIDIAIGAASSEQNIIENLLYSKHTLYQFPHFIFPIYIPAGTRLSARSQSSTGSDQTEIFMRGWTGAFPGIGGLGDVETCGASTADSGGVSIDSGGTTGVKGSWQPLITSTGFDYKWLVVAIGNQANSARTSMVGDIDIGVGAGGSEQVLIPNLRYAAHSTDDIVRPGGWSGFPVSIPAGSRISARHTNYNTTDATDRLIDVVAYGVG